MPKRKYKNQRDKARKRLLPILLIDNDNMCYWCKSPIMLRRTISENVIFKEEHGIITFYDGKRVKLASVDHVVRLADGGANDITNTVPSCWFCNNERSNSKPIDLQN